MRLLVAGLLAVVVTGALAMRAGGSVGPTADAPVLVGDAPVAAGPAATVDRATERLWLEGEARARGLAPGGELRGRVADALAADAAGFATAFDGFHARWRARTRCLPGYADPGDRCGDRPAATGGCRWMGEATVCASSRGWLAVRAAGFPRRALPRWFRIRSGGRVVELRTRAQAIAAARFVHGLARASRERVAARQRAARERHEREAVAARERREREAVAAREASARAARARDPRLAPATLAAVRTACAVQQRAAAPYLFAFGLQDPVGQAEGVLAARDALARRLGAIGDAVDRPKLAALAGAVRAGSRELARFGAAAAEGRQDEAAALLEQLDARTEPERALARRMGLGDCLARPAA